MRKTAIFRDNLFLSHDPGYNHIESPERIRTIFKLLDKMQETGELVEPSFYSASDDILRLNHSDALIETVAATSGQMYSVLDADTLTSKESYNAACLAVGAVVKGVDLLFQDEIDNGFALVRPPGHHAEKNRSMGFCLFNNVAIAAHHAIQNCGINRVMIVDWDVHHGNGTQNSFYDTDKVLYISTHQYPLYPGTGSLVETGSGRGEGYTINIPLPGGLGDVEYANVFNTLVAPACLEYQPELILVSAGFDTFIEDNISSMQLTHNGFAYMTRVMVELAETVCNGKLLISLEGGYSLAGMNRGVFAVLSELAGNDLKNELPAKVDEKICRLLGKEKSAHPVVEMVRDVAKTYWKM
jgi:acetoin utilization deacetylase AcuC-like enzyme